MHPDTREPPTPGRAAGCPPRGGPRAAPSAPSRPIVGLVLLAALATAGGSLAPPDGVATVAVLPGWTDRGGDRIAALRIHLAPGWKTYWRAPGEAGIPPRFSWDGSGNLGAVRFEWPVPEVFRLNGLDSIGYRGDLVLPMILTPLDPGVPIRLRGEIALGVCDEVCVPLTLTLVADIDGAGTPDPAIRAALARRPLTAAEAGLASAACSVEPIDDGLRLTATLRLPRRGAAETVTIETADPGVWVSDPAESRDGGTLTATADLVPPAAAPFALDRSRLRITVLTAGSAVDIRGCTAG